MTDRCVERALLIGIVANRRGRRYLFRGVEQWQLVRLITWRSVVRSHPPQHKIEDYSTAVLDSLFLFPWPNHHRLTSEQPPIVTPKYAPRARCPRPHSSERPPIVLKNMLNNIFLLYTDKKTHSMPFILSKNLHISTKSSNFASTFIEKCSKQQNPNSTIKIN